MKTSAIFAQFMKTGALIQPEAACVNGFPTKRPSGMQIALWAAMSRVQDILLQLRGLQELEHQQKMAPAKGNGSGHVTQQIESVRALIPTALLAHFDRRRARGKVGVAAVQNGVCTSCNLAIPVGDRQKLADPDELNICGNCGVYLYLPGEDQVKMVSEKKSRRKSLAKVS